MTTSTQRLPQMLRPLWRRILGHSTGRWLVPVRSVCYVA